MADSTKDVVEKDQKPEQQQSDTKGKKLQEAEHAKIIEKVNVALPLPLPNKDDYWKISEFQSGKNDNKKFLGLIRKKQISLEEIVDLGKKVELSPGNTRVIINKLRQKYANNPDLTMLSALCSYRMVLNSSDRNGILTGMKSAVQEATKALMSSVSLQNCENFFNIYFDYLSRLKRFQVSTYKSVLHEPKLSGHKKNLAMAIQGCDCLLNEKGKVLSALALVKNKFKSKNYMSTWEFKDIQMAGKAVEMGETKRECGFLTAQEMLSFVFVLCDNFARIPIVNGLVQRLLKLIPDSKLPFYLRKCAILSTQNFILYKLAAAAYEKEQMEKLAKQVFNSSLQVTKKIENQTIKQAYQSDPYFKIARIAQLTFGQFNIEEHQNMVGTAIKLMEKVIKLDMSKDHKYTEPAQALTQSLTKLLP